jgi:signal transduction histidine kinase
MANGQAVSESPDLLIHDIRSPLAAIRGYTQLLRRRAATNELNIRALIASLQHIESAASRVEGLLDELARLPALNRVQTTAFERRPTDLVQIAQRVAAASEAARLGGCQVVVLSAVPQVIGMWDTARLERALSNLLDNALKYNREDRPVAVTLRQTDTCAVISVADQGVGIPDADLARVGERGYRARNVDGQIPGTGLGLWGVHDTVAEHGGTIHLASQIGIGTTVTLHLPLGAFDCADADPA